MRVKPWSKIEIRSLRMIKKSNPKQVKLMDFQTPFRTNLDPNNRWVKLAQLIPWQEFRQIYYSNMSEKNGRRSLSARLVIGALIIKHMQGLSDEETIQTIRENPYMQYFLGYSKYTYERPFDPSLFVTIRKRIGLDSISNMNDVFINRCRELEKQLNKDQDKKKAENQGKLIVDATVAPSDIKYPTDLGLLNHARELTEKMIDQLWEDKKVEKRKPRTYRNLARLDYLKIAKQRRPRKRKIRKAIKSQLQYLRRNLSHVEKMKEKRAGIKLTPSLEEKLATIKKLYSQQLEMYKEKKNTIKDRIVSIHQPRVRPIVRGKVGKNVEFGPKISLGIVEGYCYLDYFSWDNYHEGKVLMDSVNNYKARFGCDPSVVIADQIYGTRENRSKLKSRDIRYSGKALGRPPKEGSEKYKRRKQRYKKESRERNAIEGKIGEGKRRYNLGLIQAKTDETSETWVGINILVMNIAKAFRQFFIIQFYMLKNTGKLIIILIFIGSNQIFRKNA